MMGDVGTEAVLVIDMLREFVTGKFGFERARKIVPKIQRLLKSARSRGWGSLKTDLPCLRVKINYVRSLEPGWVGSARGFG